MRRLVTRNLRHFWRTNLAVVAGVAISVAVLSGALLVGESVRSSLRALVVQRLGATEYVVAADRFFLEDLAGRLVAGATSDATIDASPIIAVKGVLFDERTGRRAYDVNVYGIDDRFWAFHAVSGQRAPEGRTALAGAPLAKDLGILTGDGLLLRIETNRGIPQESLYGRREETGRTVRLVAGDVLSTQRMGEFALQPHQADVRTLFVPLRRLQQDLAQPGRANTILLRSTTRAIGVAAIRSALTEHVTLDDVGVTLRPLASVNGVAVESKRVLLEDPFGRAAFDAAAELGWRASGVFSYLANAIRLGDREVPYSVITAADEPDTPRAAQDSFAGAEPIWLSEWAWRDLHATRGDTIEVDYYQWQDEGSLATRTARFRLQGSIATGRDVDTTFAPRFPGISEARSITGWNPPFPIDLRRIRPTDEEFWRRYQATPKALVRLATGQRLWQTRFGTLSSVRVSFPGAPRPPAAVTERSPGSPSSPVATQARSRSATTCLDTDGIDCAAFARLATALRARVVPEHVGFTVVAVKERGLDASRGSTDFGEYFVYFSFFLIGAAILLSALFFRLGIEQRAREIGTLLAVGFSMSTVRRMFLLEGAALAAGGCTIGVAGAVVYGRLIIFGLGTWWIGAVGTDRISLHVSATALGSGVGIGFITALAAIAATLRGLRRNSARALLSGALESTDVRGRRVRLLTIVLATCLLSAMLLLAGAAIGKVSDVEGFFGAGTLLLVAFVCLTAIWLRREHPAPIATAGVVGLLRLGIRNATHRPGRSLLSIALIGSAVFIVVSVEAFRRDPQLETGHPTSGTGGYSIIAESSIPIVHDPNSVAGREALGVPITETPELSGVRLEAFRVRQGDDASCLNLYAPQEPTILGASPAFVAAGRFSFQASVAATPGTKRNPWLLIEEEGEERTAGDGSSSPRLRTSDSLPDGPIPAIGDANTIQYILHRSVGDELIVRGAGGSPIRLRLVAALRDSVLQGKLVIADTHFRRAFPAVEGYRFFLVDTTRADPASLARLLMDRLSDWGVSAELTAERLAAFHRVENTYLSTFQMLGALGLVLGTVGLATVLLRNVLERRKELALLRAVGYRKSTLALVVLAENALLVVLGVASGTIAALVAIGPAFVARNAAFPFGGVGALMVAVLAGGLLSSVLAVVAALSGPVLSALRSE